MRSGSRWVRFGRLFGAVGVATAGLSVIAVGSFVGRARAAATPVTTFFNATVPYKPFEVAAGSSAIFARRSTSSR